MEAANSVIDKHLSHDGQRETTVHEHVKPAVQHEYVQPEQHEQVYTPVDRERHQEHHHTKVQPVEDREVLPEKHTHVQERGEKREFRHGSDQPVKQRLGDEAAELGLHENRRAVGPTRHEVHRAPTVEGEHVHHHVHETIQPVIHKETVQPHVVHKTKPIKEIHQHAPVHHGATQLPPVTMDDFKRQGGRLDGADGAERFDAFAGEPGSLEDGHVVGQGRGARGTTSLTHPEGNNSIGLGPVEGGDYHAPSTRHTSRETPDEPVPPSTVAHGSRAPPTRDAVPGMKRAPSATTPVPETQHKKPSLMDKLNPNKDADGDGKAGFMG